jgi:hypothetical protein
MAEGAYARLLAWATKEGVTLNVSKSPTDRGVRWSISLQITSPVKFHASGYAEDVDKTATSVIADLATIGVNVP